MAQVCTRQLLAQQARRGAEIGSLSIGLAENGAV
jgi:hypothetical protein